MTLRVGVLVCLALGWAVSSSAAEVVPAPEAFRGVREYLKGQADSGAVPAIYVAVRRGGEVIWSEAFGYRDLAEKIPASTDTLVPVASLTKPVIGTLLLLLESDGKIALDAPVLQYLPDLPIRANGFDVNGVTLRALANHRSGFPAQIGMVFPGETRLTTREQVARYGWINTAPGSLFKYTNFSYSILGDVIALAARTDWRAMAAERIFAPLGMTATAAWARDAYDGPRTRTYTRGDSGEYVPLDRVEIDSLAAASLWSTPLEYARFADMVISGGALDGAQVMTPAAAQAAVTPSTGEGRSARSVSWNLYPWRGKLRLAHAGGIPGVCSNVYAFPEDRLVVVLTINTNQRALCSEYVDRVLDAVVPNTAPEPAAKAGAAPGLDWAALRGTWRGALEMPEGPRALTMRIAGPEEIHIALEGAPEMEVAAINGKPGQSLMGGDEGQDTLLMANLPLASFPAHPYYAGEVELQFQIGLRNGKLEGMAGARPYRQIFKGDAGAAPAREQMFILPFRVSLARVDEAAAN